MAERCFWPTELAENQSSVWYTPCARVCMCRCTCVCADVRMCIYVCAYIYICAHIYICIYLHVCRESLSVHTFPSLPAPHGTKSSCGRLDESLWHGLLQRCSPGCDELCADAGRELHLEHRHLGAGLAQEQWDQWGHGMRDQRPSAPGSVCKWPCPSPTVLSSWQPVVWRGRKAVTGMQGVGKPPKSNYLSSSLGKCLLN